MVECSNCGAETRAGASFCSECGAELGAERAAAGEDAAASGDREAAASGDREAAASGDGPELSEIDAGTSGGSGGLSRRQLLGGGALVAAGAAGWYRFIRDDGASGPKSVVKRSWTTWENGNFEGYSETFHSESPDRDQFVDESQASDFGPSDGTEWAIEERTVVSQSESEATVREVYRFDAPDQEPRRFTDLYELRTEDGAWKIWAIQFEDSEPIEETTA